VNVDLDAVFERNYALVEKHTLLIKAQVRSIYDRLIEVRNLPGDCIEFGGFRGGLSFFLALCVRDLGLAKRVFMLDSFAGLPQTDAGLDGPFKRGMMVSDPQLVIQLRADLGLDALVQIVPGWFEETVTRLPAGAQYCLAHLDADVYHSTRTALQYVLPRLADGGAVVLDDCLFFGATGVVRAAEEVIGNDLHLHLGPKTQAFVFPKGDPKLDRWPPAWRTLGGRRYDVADLMRRTDYLELVAWEEAFCSERVQWYRSYRAMLTGRTEETAEDSYCIASVIGMIRRN